MTSTQLQQWVERLKTDASVQDKCKSAKTAEDIVSIAKGCGISITVESLKETGIDLSQEELEGVAGGNMNDCYTNTSLCCTAGPC